MDEKEENVWKDLSGGDKVWALNMEKQAQKDDLISIKSLRDRVKNFLNNDANKHLIQCLRSSCGSLDILCNNYVLRDGLKKELEKTYGEVLLKESTIIDSIEQFHDSLFCFGHNYNFNKSKIHVLRNADEIIGRVKEIYVDRKKILKDELDKIANPDVTISEKFAQLGKEIKSATFYTEEEFKKINTEANNYINKLKIDIRRSYEMVLGLKSLEKDLSVLVKEFNKLYPMEPEKNEGRSK